MKWPESGGSTRTSRNGHADLGSYAGRHGVHDETLRPLGLARGEEEKEKKRLDRRTDVEGGEEATED